LLAAKKLSPMVRELPQDTQGVFKDTYVLELLEVPHHLGASLKDLGKKWFAFSRMDAQSLGILERL